MSLLINRPTSISQDLERKYPFLDFWSAPQDKLTVAGAAADLDFPNVIVDSFPTDGTVRKVAPILTVRAIEDTSGAANYINAASKTLRVKLSTAGWGTAIVAITFDNLSLYCVASSKEAGPVIVGNVDIQSVVTGNATYNFRSDQSTHGDAILAKANNLELYDVQTGLRIFYS